MNLKKIIALALVVCMVLSFFPASVFAEEWDEEIVLTDEEYYEEPQEEYVEEIIEEEPADYVEYVEPVEEIVVEEPVEEPVVEEPAAEEPAAEEPAAAPAAAADLEAAETFGATTVADKYNADWSEALDSYATLQEAFNAGGNIELTKDVTEDVVVNGTVTFRALTGKKLTGNITVNSGASLTMSGNVTVENPTGVAITMNGGTLSIPERDNGSYGVVVGQGTLPGKVKGGRFASISEGLIALGYKLDGREVTTDPAADNFKVGTEWKATFSDALVASIAAQAAHTDAVIYVVKDPAGSLTFNKAGTFVVDPYGHNVTFSFETYLYQDESSTGNTHEVKMYAARIEKENGDVVEWEKTFADAVAYFCGTPAAGSDHIFILTNTPALTADTKGTINNKDITLKIKDTNNHNVVPNTTLVSGVDGYMVADVSETGATVKSYKLMPCVAKIGEVLYGSVREAVAAANDGDTITMVADDKVSFSTTALEIAINKAITIDGDGHTIFGVNSGYTGDHDIFISGSKDVTIKNVTLDGFGKDLSASNTCPIWTGQAYTGTLTLNNVTITNFARTAVNLNGGKFVIDNCTITGSGPAAGDFQQGIIVKDAVGTVTNTTIDMVGSDLERWDSAPVQLGVVTHDSTGSITLGVGNNFTGNPSVFYASGDGVDTMGKTTGTLTINGGTYKGDIIADGVKNEGKVEIKNPEAVGATPPSIDGKLVIDDGDNGHFAVAGGIFTNPVPENFCADGFIPAKNEGGTYGVEPGTIAMRVVTSGQTTGTGYAAKDVDNAVADAIAAYKEDPTKVLQVYTGTYSNVVIPNDGAMQLYCDEGVSFSVKAADELHYVRITALTTPPATVEAIDVKTGYLIESKLYQATVTEEGKEPVPFADIYKAIESAIETGGVLKPLVKYNETTNYNYGIGVGETLNVDQSGDIKLDIVKRDGVLCVINTSGEGTAKATYECAAAVASYVDGGETKYTTTFAEAAEKAAALAQTTNYEVTLYAKPTITGENPDVYTMGSGKLTVTATPTDLDQLADYDKLVVVDGEKVLTSNINETRTVATYTVEAAVARVDLNGVAPVYFTTVKDAVDYVLEPGHSNLIITPLATKTFTVKATTGEPYEGKAIKVNNAGEFKIAFESTYVKDSVGYQFVEETGENFYTYTLSASVASVAFPDGLDQYYNPKYLTKYYSTFAKAAAAAADEGLAVKLLTVPAGHAETYIVGVTSADEVLKVQKDGKNWLTVKAADNYVLDEKTVEGVTTYTVGDAVARVATDSDFNYYTTFETAAAYALTNDKAVELLDNIADPYELTDGETLNVKLEGNSVTINPKNNSAEKYAIKVTGPDAQGVTEYKSVAAVASVEKGDAVTYFADFKDAVTVAAGTEVITLLGNVTDKYELGKTIPDEILIVKKNEKTINVVSGTDKAVKDTTDETTGVTTYTLVTAVASITTGTGATAETKYYETFEEAAAAGVHVSATSAPTIVLLDDITTEYKFQRESHVLVINLNGHTLNTIGVDIAPTATVGYVVKETATETATIYSVAKAEARIGETYYETLAEAAVAAAGTETVVLLNNTSATSATYTYQLTATINKLIVNKNGQTLTVTSGVSGKAVKTTQSTAGSVLFTYELSDPTAMVERTGGNAYYDTFKEAVDDGNYARNGQVAPVIHLMKSDTTEFGLTNGYNINVELNGNEVNVVGVNNSGETKKLVIIETKDGDITNYSCVEAVAKITNGTEETYYATVGGEDGAFAAAFVPADGEGSLVVELLKAPPATDKFVGSLGYFDVDIGTTSAIIVRDNLTLENGLTATPTLISGTTYRVTIDNSPVYIVKNNGEKQYFDSIDAAKPNSDATHPIVIDAADLSYALAKGDTLYINKNGHNDFVVTKVDPELNYRPDADIQYSILENTVGDVTTYTTGAGVAFIDFSHEEDDGDYGTKTVHNYVFYDTFDDAVEAAAGIKTIVVNAARGGYPAGQDYTLEADETLIVDVQFIETFVTDVVRAPEGGILNDEVDGTVHTLTVGEAVAIVTVPGVAAPAVFDDLEEAIDFAIEKLPNNGVLKLLAEVPEDFTYEFGNLDKLLVSNLAGDYKFADGVLTAPEGKYVKGTGTMDPADCKLYEVKDLLATVEYEDGDEIVTAYFDTFAPAVDLVESIEIAKPYNDETRDPVNPTTPITLWMNNPDTGKYTFSNDVGAIKSLMIETNGFDPNFAASDDNHFIEAVATTFGGPVQFKYSLKVAQIDSSPAWATAPADKIINFYSSFAAAANDAIDTEYFVEILANSLEDDDVYAMPIGTLTVKGNADVKPADFITNRVITPDGDQAVLSYKAEGAETDYKGTFTVSGSEAMIVYQDQTTAPRYFKTFLDAVIAQNGNEYLPIIPLTDISKTYVESDLNGIRTFYIDPNAKYSVDVKVKNFEVLKDETYTASEKYDIIWYKFFVETDKIESYDTNNKPIYEREYFADLGRASVFAANTKVIHVAAPAGAGTYVLGAEDVNEVLNLYFEDSVALAIDLSSGQEGYGVKDDTPTELGARARVYKLAGLVTVTVDSGDGVPTTPTEIIGVPGAPISWNNYAYPTLEGYSLDYFEGSDGKNYATTARTGMEPMPTVIPENDLTMTAKYNANQYWVVYSDGTNPDKYVKATFGQLITPPEDPDVPAHKTFDGWYYGDEKFDFAATTFNKSLITDVTHPATGDTYTQGEGLMLLTANFDDEVYTVKFETGINVTIPEQKLTYGMLVVNPFDDEEIREKMVRDGYEPWNGAWHTLDADGNEVNWVFRSTGVTENTTLITTWEPKTMTLTWANESTVLATTEDVDVGSPLTPLTVYGTNPVKRVVDLQKEGYRLDPDNLWIDLPDTVPYDESGTRIFQLNWIEQIPVSFTYEGEVLDTINVDKNSTLADNDNVPTPGVGKIYTWTLKGEPYDLNTPVTEKMTLVGTIEDKPVEDMFEVTFSTDHGDTPETQIVKSGETADEPVAPTEEGWTFVGWFKGETEFDFDTPITEDTELVAKWNEDDTARFGVSLELEGVLQMNALVRNVLHEDQLENYLVTAVFDGEESASMTLDQAEQRTTSSGLRYVVPVAFVPAKNMIDKVHVVLSYVADPDHPVVIQEQDVSVQDYCDGLILQTSNAKLIEMLKATLDYGAFAQRQLNYKTATLANATYPDRDAVVRATTVSDSYKIESITGNCTGLGDTVGKSLNMVASTELWIMFKPENVSTIGSYTFTIDGVEVEAEAQNNRFVVKLAGAPSNELDVKHTFVATNKDDGSSMTVEYSTMAFCYEAQSTSQFGDLSKAVARYHIAAKAYFG